MTQKVAVATDADLPYVVDLQNRNRESVGHLPTPAISERVARGSLLLLTVNDDHAGYLLYDYRDGVIRIPQACIQYDIRRRHHGEALVIALCERHPDVQEIRLRCAADIEANVFWRSMGFTCTAVQKGGQRRGRLINLWTKQFTSALFTLAEIAVKPAVQIRVDCMYDDTGFMSAAPPGFSPATHLPKLAWSNRKANP